MASVLTVVLLVLLMIMSHCQVIDDETICVWNSIEHWRHLNGEYVLQSESHNNVSFWKQALTSLPTSNCSQEHYYIYAVYYYEKIHWVIHYSLNKEYTYGYPLCDNRDHPTQCVYYVYPDAVNAYELPLTVTHGSCPSLSCDYISLTNTGESKCDNVFTADSTKHNVFIHNSIYFYFNPYIFKWVCSDDSDTGCTGTQPDAFVSTIDDEWMDMIEHGGFSYTMDMGNGYIATFSCIDQFNMTSTSGTGIERVVFIGAPSQYIYTAVLLCVLFVLFAGVTVVLLRGRNKEGATPVILSINTPKRTVVNLYDNQQQQSHTVYNMEKDSDIVYESDIEQDKAVMAAWFDTVVGLLEYYPLFVENGFDSIECIKAITDISWLKKIGIESLEDQRRIFSEIQVLNLMGSTDVDQLPVYSVENFSPSNPLLNED